MPNALLTALWSLITVQLLSMATFTPGSLSRLPSRVTRDFFLNSVQWYKHTELNNNINGNSNRRKAHSSDCNLDKWNEVKFETVLFFLFSLLLRFILDSLNFLKKIPSEVFWTKKKINDSFDINYFTSDGWDFVFGGNLISFTSTSHDPDPCDLKPKIKPITTILVLE